MRNIRAFTIVISSINIIGSIACLILMLVSKSKGFEFWGVYAPISIALLINALAFTAVGDLGDRMDRVEDALKRNNVQLEPKKKEKIEPDKPRDSFRVGEPIRLKNQISIDGKEFGENSSGIVLSKNNNKYIIEFDEDRGEKYEVKNTDLKSYFDK